MKLLPAFFKPNGSMHHGCKAGWLTAVLKETHLILHESDKCAVLVEEEEI